MSEVASEWLANVFRRCGKPLNLLLPAPVLADCCDQREKLAQGMQCTLPKRVCSQVDQRVKTSRVQSNREKDLLARLNKQERSFFV
ncbi:hypothetical protein KOR42_51490 [Thalassoglobus neptunius]|uniref:Uncharacterized protein n=1 Tax=Thalassoglobus neptunius TaxID=1938619 RepID=A0A5C5VPU4_9PLAN|nr:hypothetical protein KOR42_51490 [Thalassoglobus neptunius]